MANRKTAKKKARLERKRLGGHGVQILLKKQNSIQNIQENVHSKTLSIYGLISLLKCLEKIYDYTRIN